MTWLRRILPILSLLCLPSLAHANPRYNGFCMKGGQTVLTSNLPGTPQVMASYPQCTITVFLHGTTNPATLFSDQGITPLGNPFSSDGFGYFFFYVASGTRVDIQLSGVGIATYTIGDVVLLDIAGKISSVLILDGVQFTSLASVVAACVSPGATIWVPDGTNPVLSSVVTIFNPCHIIFGKNTITCTMADPGIGSGCINVASDNVEIEGQGPLSLITQGNAANIENAIFLGSHKNIRIHGMKFDWNDANQTATAGFYTCIRSSAGSSDIRIYDNEFTRGGDRAIDLRGENRSWIGTGGGNYFHQTGLNVAGVANRGGNSVSVDVDGTTQSTDCWIENNIVEEQGDALACGRAIRAHIRSNTIRGRADFGNTPMTVESGIDATGDTGAEIIGNHLWNVRGPQLGVDSTNISGTNYVATEITVEGNDFHATTSCCGLPATDPRVSDANGSAVGVIGQALTHSFIGNKFFGVRLSISSIGGLDVKGNSFHNILSTIALGIAIDLEQSASGSVMKNFVVSGNTASTDNATLLSFLNFGAGITAPDSCVITDNATSTGVTSDLTAQGGSSFAICLVSRSNKTIGNYSNAASSISLRNASTPDQFIISVGGGTPPLNVSGNSNPVGSLVVSNHPQPYACGTTSSCTGSLTTLGKIVFGSAPLVSGSPSTVTITGMPAFTSSSSYNCTATDVTNAANNLLKVVNVNTTSFTITGPNTLTDVINYICVGN